MKRVLFLGLILFAVGCTPPSMNYQRSGLRCVGDGGVTALLENVAEDKVDEARFEVINISKAVLKFLEDGKVKDLTESQLKQELEKLVPEKYRSYYEALIAAVSSQQVDVYKIGANNVARIRAVVVGGLQAAELYKKSDRQKKVTAVITTGHRFGFRPVNPPYL